MNGNKFHYVYSSSVDEPVQIKIGTLEGKFPKPAYHDLCKDASLEWCVASKDQSGTLSDLFVTVQVYQDNRKLGIPICTKYKSFTKRYSWNEWLTLPVRFNELSRDAQLAITVWDYHDSMEKHAVGGTTISLFKKSGLFRRGIYDLKVWPFKEGDGSVPTSTSGKLKCADPTPQMSRLSKLTKKHRTGLIEHVDWLDRLTFREIEQINEYEKRSSNLLFLMVDFPEVQHSDVKSQDYFIVYYEPDTLTEIEYDPYPEFITVPDPELHLDFDENLVEAKHLLLSRNPLSGIEDRDLKPNAASRDKLARIVQMPANETLNASQCDLVWKFRFYLKSNRKALPKFLKCVKWENTVEVEQALELLQQWEPMDVEDALELFSPHYTHPAVRRYAVSRLKSSSKQELLLYLLQLVQALKYERMSQVQPIEASLWATSTITGDGDNSVDERSQKMYDEMESAMNDSTVVTENMPATPTRPTTSTGESSSAVVAEFDHDDADLATFLINRSCQDSEIANFFYWYLRVECSSIVGQHFEPVINQEISENSACSVNWSVYQNVQQRLLKALLISSKKTFDELRRQNNFVERLIHIMRVVAKSTGKTEKKIEYLRAQLRIHDVHFKIDLSHLDHLPLPIDPSITVKSIIPDLSALFNSGQAPSKLVFRTSTNDQYITIFKHGDDLRQDQLVLQIITLMDLLLKKENLDLKLTPYSVLATSVSDGFVQFVNSKPLRDVTPDIQNYLRIHNMAPGAPYGIKPEALDNYVKSLAGYSVICYILGIGDRHLHNLMLCEDGKLFHIDFGFILGRDPKPMAPPIKLTKDMVEAMGGLNSQNWQEFRKLCYEAYLGLRRHATVILNLFSLMVDASIPDIALEPDKTVQKVQDRFRLDLNDEQAVIFVQNLIEVSLSAKMAALVDIAHDFAQWLNK